MSIGSIKKHQGVGMIEVLVAVLLLALGVIGYVALQVKATTASAEALTRTQVTTLLRETAERIRANSVDSTVLGLYKTALNAGTIPTTPTCTTACTTQDLVNLDVNAVGTMALANGIKLGMDTCPGTADKAATQCLIAAWGTTTATLGAAPACMDATTGKYVSNNCMVMEAY